MIQHYTSYLLDDGYRLKHIEDISKILDNRH